MTIASKYILLNPQSILPADVATSNGRYFIYDSYSVPIYRFSGASLSIRRFWGKRGKTEAKKGES